MAVQFCAGAQIIRTKNSFLPCEASAFFQQVQPEEWNSTAKRHHKCYHVTKHIATLLTA